MDSGPLTVVKDQDRVYGKLSAIGEVVVGWGVRGERANTFETDTYTYYKCMYTSMDKIAWD